MASYYDWIVLILLLVVVTWMWVHAYKKEQSAAPVVTNLTQTPTQLLQNSISVQERVSGKSGYSRQGLGQPCVKSSSEDTEPNIPVGFKTGSCDSDSFLECFSGVVDGGGICLRKLYGPCLDMSECTPEADYCMNGYCQKKTTTVNKICTNDSECRGLARVMFLVPQTTRWHVSQIQIQ